MDLFYFIYANFLYIVFNVLAVTQDDLRCIDHNDVILYIVCFQCSKELFYYPEGCHLLLMLISHWLINVNPCTFFFLN